MVGGWMLADTWTDAEAALALLGTRELWADWRLEVSFYLARLLFALSAVPFVLFELPGLQALLSHTHPTGYSRLGECVPQDTRGAAAYCEWLRRTLRQRKALEGWG